MITLGGWCLPIISECADPSQKFSSPKTILHAFPERGGGFGLRTIQWSGNKLFSRSGDKLFSRGRVVDNVVTSQPLRTLWHHNLFVHHSSTMMQAAMEVDTQPHLQSVPQGPFLTRRYSLLGTGFECPDRYQLNRPIGQGAYGIVCSALDVRTGAKVAIKKIAGIVDNVIDCKRTLREMKLLRHFKHENVIRIKDVYVPSTDGPNFQDVYTVSELMDTDLHQIISSNQVLTDDHCQYFTYQILKALKHIHSANVLHRDLKPSNILLNGNCDLKICDFGLARGNPEDHGALTAYVATRWYRAPEIMLSWREYTKAVDMWSVGCIIGEILLRRPLFPGRDTLHQLHLVTDVTGTPTASDLASINSEKGRNYVERHLMNKPRKSMADLFPNASEQLWDLLGRMLVFDPSRRITVEEALAHPYLQKLHDESDEPICPTVFDFEFDHMGDVSKNTLRQLIWQEANAYRQRDAEEYEKQRMG